MVLVEVQVECNAHVNQEVDGNQVSAKRKPGPSPRTLSGEKRLFTSVNIRRAHAQNASEIGVNQQ